MLQTRIREVPSSIFGWITSSFVNFLSLPWLMSRLHSACTDLVLYIGLWGKKQETGWIHNLARKALMIFTGHVCSRVFLNTVISNRVASVVFGCGRLGKPRADVRNNSGYVFLLTLKSSCWSTLRVTCQQVPRSRFIKPWTTQGIRQFYSIRGHWKFVTVLILYIIYLHILFNHGNKFEVRRFRLYSNLCQSDN
jgi:hypothetical protein